MGDLGSEPGSDSGEVEGEGDAGTGSGTVSLRRAGFDSVVDAPAGGVGVEGLETTTVEEALAAAAVAFFSSRREGTAVAVLADERD
jgi:hypothetical protein